MPTQTQSLSSEVLNAALHGLEAQKQSIEKHIQQVRSMLGLGTGRRGRPPKSASAATESPAPVRRGRKKRSPEVRARMAAAQRKRWAALKSTKGAPAKTVVKKKRRLSAAGRKAIIEATKKRWAEYKAKKEAQ
jgi:hypothetical protein